MGSIDISNGFIVKDGVLVRYSADSTEVVVPDYVEKIYDSAFIYKYDIKSIELSKSVRFIDSATFEDLMYLERITVHKDNPWYDSRDNSNCIIETATNTLAARCRTSVVPKGVVPLEFKAVQAQNGVLERYRGGDSVFVVPENIVEILSHAFTNLEKLRELHISANVQEIGTCPVMWCKNLERLTVDADNKFYDSRDNCNAIIHTSTNTLVAACKNTVVPPTVRIIDTNAYGYKPL